MKQITLYESTDGSKWENPDDAVRRDVIDAIVIKLEESIPAPPKDYNVRLKVNADAISKYKAAIVKLCREEFQKEKVFQYPSEKIHPMSFAGRFLDDVGGPIARAWRRLSYYRDGYLYQQPFYALNPDKWQALDNKETIQ